MFIVQFIESWGNKRTLRKLVKDQDPEIAVAALTLLFLLESPSFIGKNLGAVQWPGANLSGRKFNQCDLSGSNLSNCKLKDDAMFMEANLKGVNFSTIDSEEIHLDCSKAAGAIFDGARLRTAHMGGTDLRHASFVGANMKDARLHEADLYGANFTEAYLSFTDFTNANLEGAVFDSAIWEERNDAEMPWKGWNTILPDGTTHTPESDLERFTNRTHPDFWRPDQPVYWGGKYGLPSKDDC